MPLAQEIYQEGIRIPPTLLVRRGKVDQQILALLLANVRTPNEREGDLLAQLMAIERGRSRVLNIVKRYGYSRVASNIRGLMDYSERRMRARIAQLPEGEYTFSDHLDSDGVSEKPVRVSATLRIAAARCVLDFSHSDPQAAGPVNANNAVTLSAASYVLRCLLPDDVPFTAGLMRPVEIINPPGRVTNALPPAAMAAGNVETSQRITDVILGAFAQADPKAIPAASSGTMNNISFGGYDPYRSKPFAYYETIAGGMGAGPANNGLTATHTHMTNSLNTPIEAFEHQYPVRITQYRVRRGSGGPGRTRGGDGIVREYEFLTPAEVTILADRRTSAPYGLQGGASGTSGLSSVRKDDHWEPLPGKTRFNVKAGQVVRIETPGGGGFGQFTPPNSL
jgi:N-methylhydantoinase B